MLAAVFYNTQLLLSPIQSSSLMKTQTNKQKKSNLITRKHLESQGHGRDLRTDQNHLRNTPIKHSDRMKLWRTKLTVLISFD